MAIFGVLWGGDIEECLLKGGLSWMLKGNAEKELGVWVRGTDLGEALWDSQESLKGFILWCGKGGAEDWQDPKERGETHCARVSQWS